jgi:3-methylcrotonyl-CoA carboxylase alpha subunit
MITSILVANRGEIACRVIKTCRLLGIKVYSIFAEDDQFLPHVKQADYAFSLGSGTLKETYLNQDKIIQLVLENKIQAIHPGFGFLSENSEFCRKVKKAGVIFIGPSPEAMNIMGDKITSKIAMEKSKVPLIPGYHGENQDSDFLLSEAKKIGFPVMVKASAGGGGKGMRIVHQATDFLEALAGAKREAQNAFGNDKILLEKYIQKPRHIEVQVMSDQHGGHYHFFERECSIQRRHQKIVEETPSVALSDKLRQDICETAVKVAKNIQYEGAGTVEFIYSEGQFYFLEMNTRLQVEHPITEMVTGHDLVEWQIVVASGLKLPFKQEDIKQKGHAIECRIYAEDPDNNFLPVTGKFTTLEMPNMVNSRWECGFETGNEVTIHYDPMIGKLIVWDRDRQSCIRRMVVALNNSKILGLKTNRDYLKKVVAHPAFARGETYTDFVIKNEKDLGSADISDQEMAWLLAGYFLNSGHTTKNTSQNISHQKETSWTQLQNFRNC